MTQLPLEPKSEEALREEATARERIRSTVHPERGLIPGFIFTDPVVYQLELDNIFMESWMFVAHETEIPRPGDFVLRELAETSVIVARGQDGVVRVFLNLCRHRGMRITRTDQGNCKVFQCPYHGFTYQNTGELIGVPEQKDAYGDRLRKDALGLVQARVGIYRGLIFASLSASVEPLEEYLGPMRWYLDLVAGRSDMEVLGAPQRWVVKSNWKVAAENFMDSYHLLYTHASIGKLGLTPNSNYIRSGFQVNAGHGHGLGVGLPSTQPIFPENVVARFRDYVNPDQADLLLRLNNLNGTVFPNLSILISSVVLKGQLISHTSLRQWQPRGPNELVVYSWFLVEKSAPEEWKERSRQTQSLTFSVSGMYEQDDTEMWTHVTQNLSTPFARRYRVDLDYQMGLDKEPTDTFVGPGKIYAGKLQEMTARQYYERWRDLLVGPVAAPPPSVAGARSGSV